MKGRATCGTCARFSMSSCPAGTQMNSNLIVIALRLGDIGEVAENASRGCGLAQLLPSAKGLCTGFLCGAVPPQQRLANGQSVELGGDGRPVYLLASERQTFLRELER